MYYTSNNVTFSQRIIVVCILWWSLLLYTARNHKILSIQFTRSEYTVAKESVHIQLVHLCDYM